MALSRMRKSQTKTAQRERDAAQAEAAKFLQQRNDLLQDKANQLQVHARPPERQDWKERGGRHDVLGHV